MTMASSPKYKLKFFNTMSYAEPIRFIFAYANVEYEDVRIKREDWPNMKETVPWGKLPVLEFDDGRVLCQSRAIARYLARNYNLAGESDFDAAKIDEYVDIVDDIREECIKYFHEREEGKKQTLLKRLDDEVFPKYLNKFTSIIATNRNDGSNGFLVGKSLSIADIFLCTLIGQLVKLLASSDLLGKYQEIKEHMALVESQPGIKEWIVKRPITPF